MLQGVGCTRSAARLPGTGVVCSGLSVIVQSGCSNLYSMTRLLDAKMCQPASSTQHEHKHSFGIFVPWMYNTRVTPFNTVYCERS